MPPPVIADACSRFDQLLMDKLSDLVGVSLSPLSMGCAQAPLRMGGLGVFSQQSLSPYAFGAAFTLSQGVMREKGLPMCDPLHQYSKQYVDLCASAIDMPVDELLQSGFREIHLQSRAVEPLHLRKWQERFGMLREEGLTHLLVQMAENTARPSAPTYQSALGQDLGSSAPHRAAPDPETVGDPWQQHE